MMKLTARKPAALAALGLALAWVSPALWAHPANLIGAVLNVQPDGRFDLRLQFNGLAFVIDDAPERIPASSLREIAQESRPALEAMVADGRERMRRGLAVESAGTAVPIELTLFPTADEIAAAARSDPSVSLSHPFSEAVATGRLPDGHNRVTVSFPEVIGTVVLTVDIPGQEAAVDAVAGGDRSQTFEFTVAGPRDASSHSGLDSFRHFVRLGFQHILPEGLDHILFVIGLFLLNARFLSLLSQVTAFTVAHSITLGLSLYGVVRLSPAIVEPLIALSIVLIAVDNLRSKEVRPQRILLVFFFGLVHGLGFAGALHDLHLERGQFATALVGFNLGIEIGQLAVIALAFAAVGWARGRAGYRRFVIVPASAMIAIVALFWTIERIV